MNEGTLWRWHMKQGQSSTAAMHPSPFHLVTQATVGTIHQLTIQSPAKSRDRQFPNSHQHHYKVEFIISCIGKYNMGSEHDRPHSPGANVETRVSVNSHLYSMSVTTILGD